MCAYPHRDRDSASVWSVPLAGGRGETVVGIAGTSSSRDLSSSQRLQLIMAASQPREHIWRRQTARRMVVSGRLYLAFWPASFPMRGKYFYLPVELMEREGVSAKVRESPCGQS